MLYKYAFAVDDEPPNNDPNLNQSQHKRRKTSSNLQSRPGIVRNWEILYIRLFDKPENDLDGEEVEQILMEMLEYERTNSFKISKHAARLRLDKPIDQFDNIERFIRSQKLIPFPDYGLTETLLRTFRNDENNCMEHELSRFENLVKVIKKPAIHNAIEQNYKAQLDNCWVRLMNTLGQMSNWLGRENFRAFDGLIEILRLPSDKFIS